MLRKKILKSYASGGLLVCLQWLHPVQWPRLFDPAFEFKMDDQLVLTTQQLDQQLHKNIEHVSLIAVTDRVHCQSHLRVHDREPGGDGEYLEQSQWSVDLLG